MSDERPGTVIGQIVVVADAEVIAANPSESTPEPDEEDQP